MIALTIFGMGWKIGVIEQNIPMTDLDCHMERKFKSRVKRKLNGNHLGVEVTLVRFALARVLQCNLNNI